MAVDNDIYIFAYDFANVGMKPDRNGWNIFVHLYNKKSPKIWWARYGIRELGVSYCWGLSNVLLVPVPEEEGGKTIEKVAKIKYRKVMKEHIKYHLLSVWITVYSAFTSICF